MNFKEKMLVITMEECGELTRACSKVLRHGVLKDEKYIKNLKEELADVQTMLRVIAYEYAIDEKEIEDLVIKRTLKMAQKDYI